MVIMALLINELDAWSVVLKLSIGITERQLAAYDRRRLSVGGESAASSPMVVVTFSTSECSRSAVASISSNAAFCSSVRSPSRAARRVEFEELLATAPLSAAPELSERRKVWSGLIVASTSSNLRGVIANAAGSESFPPRFFINSLLADLYTARGLLSQNTSMWPNLPESV